MSTPQLVQTFEGRLARRSRIIAFWSVAGAVLVLTSLIYSSVHLVKLQHKKQQAEADLVTLQHKKQQAEADLNEKQALLQQVNTKLAKAKQTANVCGLTLDAISAKSPRDATMMAFSQAVSQVHGAAGISIQIAYKTQLENAKQIASELRKLGYEVPPDSTIEIRGKRISHTNDVRYFFSEDKETAEKISAQIRAMGVDAQPYSLVGAPDLGDVSPRNFEFRLGLNYQPGEIRRVAK